MDAWPLLGAAGFASGLMNALAGGGSFVSLPALIAAGLPSVTANASSTVALFPGGAASAWAYRRGQRPGTAADAIPLNAALAVTIVGGLVGSVVLLATPSHAFDRILPWLLAAATVMLAFGPRWSEAVRGRLKSGRASLLAGQFLLGIYGGYFGGAVGIMMLAYWSLVIGGEIKDLQAPRTLLVTAANAAAVVWFVIARAVDWRAIVIMAPAALLGGWLGAQLGRSLPARWVRRATITLAALVTVAFFVRGFG
jgi:uncharacterized membrane protein YfcA